MGVVSPNGATPSRDLDVELRVEKLKLVAWNLVSVWQGGEDKAAFIIILVIGRVSPAPNDPEYYEQGYLNDLSRVGLLNELAAFSAMVGEFRLLVLAVLPVCNVERGKATEAREGDGISSNLVVN